jgi:hypothetical protein
MYGGRELAVVFLLCDHKDYTFLGLNPSIDIGRATIRLLPMGYNYTQSYLDNNRMVFLGKYTCVSAESDDRVQSVYESANRNCTQTYPGIRTPLHRFQQTLW